MHLSFALLVVTVLLATFLLFGLRPLERHVHIGLAVHRRYAYGTVMPLALLYLWVFFKETIIGATLAALTRLLTGGESHSSKWLVYAVVLCTLTGVVYEALANRQIRPDDGKLLRIFYTVLAPATFAWAFFAPNSLPTVWSAWFRLLTQM